MLGYMGFYEWDGNGFVDRERSERATQWADEKTREQWRLAFLAALEKDDVDGAEKNQM